ncbi:hypothetical protein C7B65_14275 [Phormidesmis priestleyi ULC007]|uniref:Uncharacterized protein n=1 Tax=Phormidesmis priestleyi ULC007 TaxID=1920490 RepID=A0A2T1DDZ8_9CYAN|nr:hypothetical protein [Phormidesmis priestleyi]PSB18687.1 hypothetical protein C7B65_14275 [Phormidesmis priestleyi ULC007]PZO51552.1 MAG: hypothetical protein DCF14_08595 [Phormidesmis priestleyi]
MRHLTKRPIQQSVIATLTIVSLTLSAPFGHLTPLPAIAQSIRPQDAWQQVYKQIPDLPLENQYINRTTQKVDPNNTLVSRLIRYHQYVKGRPINYRLDWKMTLGDYLGVNEPIIDTGYPGSNTLRKNPLEGDRGIINRLTRKQRDALVQALVNVFSPTARQPIPNPIASPQPPSMVMPDRPTQPSGAQLLKP